jgi:hypothetical protein
MPKPKSRPQEELAHIKASWTMSDDGILVWARDAGRGKKAGDAVGVTTLKSGSQNCYLRFDGKLKGYSVGQVAWFLYHGEWPSLEVDHVNCQPDDHRSENLRLATRQEQCFNRAAGRKGRANKGVYRTPTGKWVAQMWVDGKAFWLGTHLTEEDAAHARIVAASKTQGAFANTKSYEVQL